MRGQRWIIKGCDGLNVLMKYSTSVVMMSEAQVITMLQRLACLHLTPEEIVAASSKKGSTGYSPALEPQTTGRPRRTIQVGSNPYYVAALYEDGESEKDD